MLTKRYLTTVLALISLLVGNGLGWLHVGCHSSGDPCCHVAKASSKISVLADAGHKCCHYSQNPFKHRATCQPQDGDAANPNQQSDPQPAGGEHDSDSCFVCQNFFASRQALITSDVAFVWEPAITQQQCVCISSLLPEAVFLSGVSVRGPPRA